MEAEAGWTPFGGMMYLNLGTSRKVHLEFCDGFLFKKRRHFCGAKEILRCKKWRKTGPTFETITNWSFQVPKVCTYCSGETNPSKSHDYGLEKWKLLPMVAVTSNRKKRTHSSWPLKKWAWFISIWCNKLIQVASGPCAHRKHWDV